METRLGLWGVLAIGAAGGLGTLVRFGVDRLSPYPWGTLGVNLVGAFLAGVLLAVFRSRGLLSEFTFLCLGVGFLGGFTTFSAYAVQSVDLWLRGGEMRLWSLVYLFMSPILGFALAWLGFRLG